MRINLILTALFNIYQFIFDPVDIVYSSSSLSRFCRVANAKNSDELKLNIFILQKVYLNLSYSLLKYVFKNVDLTNASKGWSYITPIEPS